MPDDLSSAVPGTIRGIDLVAGTIGRTTRGGPQVPATVAVAAVGVIGSAVECAGHGEARLDLNVTAVAGGAPSVTVVIETSYDNGVTDAWRQVAAYAAQAAVTANPVRLCTAGLDRWIRARASAYAAGPVTLSLSGELI